MCIYYIAVNPQWISFTNYLLFNEHIVTIRCERETFNASI